MLNAGRIWLARHKQTVNALNVFPVPDGDTGTNMSQTMTVACRELGDGDHAGEVAQRLAQGALMGARGNSGVILSQIWRGFADEVGTSAEITPTLFAAGLQNSADTAYRGVMTPVEGTILSVMRAAAAAAVIGQDEDMLALLDQTLTASRAALAKTPEQLPILKQAGVVDSGGQGLVFLFEGMVRYLRGELLIEEGSAETTPVLTPQALAQPTNGQLVYPYDVQFLLSGDDLNIAQVRQDIGAMGDSTVIVGDAHMIKVHVHVADPGVPLSYGVSLGMIHDVVVENMQEQMEEIISDSHLLDVTLDARQIGVVAVAVGAGLQTAFASLGVAEVIDGGQTNNPSTAEIYQAILRVPSQRVIVLPNNKNILMAAQKAAELSEKQVHVVPTDTIPQGIGAMMNYAPDGELAAVVEGMCAAAEEIISAEITRAVRNVTIDAVDVTAGQLISIVDGKLQAASAVLDDVLLATLAQIDLDERELLTLYYGAEVTEAEAHASALLIEQNYPDLEIEIVNGGQPHYLFILGIE